MVVAVSKGDDRASLLAEDVMKKGFFNAYLGVMLVASFYAGAMAQPSAASMEEKKKKEKVQIVVAEKKERGRSDGRGEPRKPRP
jgi:hypothetical protein